MTGIYNALDYNIIGDGEFNNTDAFNLLLKTIGDNGGGTLYVPPGRYVTGSIQLKANTTLHLEAGAVLLGSCSPEDFPLITDKEIPGWKGRDHRALISAYKADNITITGRGTIDGRGGIYWWPHKNKEDPRRPRCIQLIDCRNVLISDISICNSPAWTVHPAVCENVTVSGITIKNPADSPNTDGINPEGCKNVHISNCNIDVGDDCIAIKAGTQDEIFLRRPCENITITNCTMINGHGGVVIGSEMSGGVRHIVISNCVFNGTDRGIRIKTRRKRGGCVEDVRVTGISMKNVFCPFVLNGYYQCGASADDMSLFTLDPLPADEGTPVFKDISVSGVTATDVSACAMFFYGIPESPITGVSVTDFSVKFKKGAAEPQYPAMIHHIPAMAKAGIKLRYAQDCSFRNIRIDTDSKDGSPMSLSSCSYVSVDGLNTRTWSDSSKLELDNCEDVDLRNIGTLPLKTDGCSNISLNGLVQL